MSDDKYLAIYLNDHLAGSVVAVELSRRAARSNRNSAYGATLRRLADEINEDRQALKDLMQRLGVRGDPVKVLASWTGEKAGRLKLNGELVRYSPLSRLEEIELLSLGVEGKLAMWRALRERARDDPRLASLDYETLIARGTSQRRRLERVRLRAAEEAFG
jgi:hypothetical protein